MSKLLLILSIVICCISTREIAAQPPGFPCDGSYYLSQINNPPTQTTIYKVEFNNTITFTPVVVIPVPINAIGFNRTNNYIYGTTYNTTGPENIIEVHGDGSFVDLGNPSNFSHDLNYAAGDFTADGIFVVTGWGENIHQYDLSSGGITSVHSADKNYTSGGYTGTPKFSDIAIHPITGVCYGIDMITHRLTTIDIQNGDVEFVGSQGQQAPGIGALFFNSVGELYGYEHQTLYEVDIITGSVIPVIDGPVSYYRDGCSCPYGLDMFLEGDVFCGSPLDSIRYTYTLINNGIDTVLGVSLSHNIKSEHQFSSVSSFLLEGNIVPGTGPGYSSLQIENMIVPPGNHTIELFVNQTGLTANYPVTSQAYLHDLPVYMSDTILSDDPITHDFDDSTTVEIPGYYVLVDDTLCEGDLYALPDGELISPGVGSYQFVDTITTAFGCDSIIETQLTVHPIYEHHVYDTICSNEDYMLPDGQLVNVTGTYTITFSTINDCDSTIHTHLFVHLAYDIVVHKAICDGDSTILPNGNAVYISGQYTSSFNTKHGCDSSITTVVTVHPNYERHVTDTICEGDALMLTAGDYLYTDSLQSAYSCDSTIHSKLTVFSVHSVDVFDSICIGQSYVLPNGDVINQGGIYTQTVQNDSVCYEITSHIYQDPQIPSIDFFQDTTFCAEDPSKLLRVDEYDGIEYQWNTGNVGPFIEVDHVGTYIVFIRQEDFCWITDTIEVSIRMCRDDCYVVLPTAFSPDGNGSNDFFQVLTNCPNVFSFFELSIYNRWGERVFYTDDIDSKWNGFFGFEEASSGVFVYTISYATEDGYLNESLHGTVTLIR